jgi:hypothetical protein
MLCSTCPQHPLTVVWLHWVLWQWLNGVLTLGSRVDVVEWCGYTGSPVDVVEWCGYTGSPVDVVEWCGYTGSPVDVVEWCGYTGSPVDVVEWCGYLWSHVDVVDCSDCYVATLWMWWNGVDMGGSVWLPCGCDGIV